MNELVDTLLYEGYALYPYTPGATKNATPTPFGIVYPRAYARSLSSAYDHLELQCLVEGGLTDVLGAVDRPTDRVAGVDQPPEVDRGAGHHHVTGNRADGRLQFGQLSVAVAHGRQHRAQAWVASQGGGQ